MKTCLKALAQQIWMGAKVALFSSVLRKPYESLGADPLAPLRASRNQTGDKGIDDRVRASCNKPIGYARHGERTDDTLN